VAFFSLGAGNASEAPIRSVLVVRGRVVESRGDDVMSFCQIDHALADVLLTRLRDVDTGVVEFRAAADALSTLLAASATADLAVSPRLVRTPLAEASGSCLTRPVVLVPVLRAGLAMVDPLLRLMPWALVGHLGMARDEETAVARTYLCRLPDLSESTVLVLDPMLATGGSLCDALDRVKERGARDVRALCLVAAPEGVARVERFHPDVSVTGVGLDDCLDDRRFIVPGLGDFGDRLCGFSG
jgi:uracil phosphoribosyltransferase